MCCKLCRVDDFMKLFYFFCIVVDCFFCGNGVVVIFGLILIDFGSIEDGFCLILILDILKFFMF